jgi:hypothetical protein
MPTSRVSRVRVLTLALALAGSAIAPAQANPVFESIRTSVSETLDAVLLRQAPALDPRVLALALEAHDRARARGLLRDSRTLTVIDYSKPSLEERFWVFDLASRRLLFQELVAHGKNSGEMFATRFSNTEASLQTSLGLFVTRDVYYGKHGESLRLEGLEPGVNDRALARAIVIHGADYVSPTAVTALGFLGRSWGCPALAPQVAPQVIERIQGGSAVFAFYPDFEWLAKSRFLSLGSGARVAELAMSPPQTATPVLDEFLPASVSDLR